MSRTGIPGVLQFMGSQRVGHETERLNWTELKWWVSPLTPILLDLSWDWMLLTCWGLHPPRSVSLVDPSTLWSHHSCLLFSFCYIVLARVFFCFLVFFVRENTSFASMPPRFHLDGFSEFLSLMGMRQRRKTCPWILVTDSKSTM